MPEISNLCHCVQHPWKLNSRHCRSSRNTEKTLSKLKHVLRKCSGVSQKWWMPEISNLCHCVQHPWKHTSRHYRSSRNTKKPLSKLKHVFSENAEEYLRNGECQRFQIFAIVFSTPQKLNSRHCRSSRNTEKTLSKLKTCFQKMQRSISEMVNARDFKSLPLCSASLKTY